MKNKYVLQLLLLSIFVSGIQTMAAFNNLFLGQKSATATPYVQNSVLSENRFYKIKVAKSGVYKLTFEELTAMGIDPVNVRVYGYGGAILNRNLLLQKYDDLPELAIWMEKGTDQVFNAGDYILFYAQGPVSWEYNKNVSMFTHTANTYSCFGYYFVTSAKEQGRSIQPKTTTLPANATVNTVSEFTDYQLHERDLISILNSGKEFYGETFNDLTSYNFEFDFPNVVPNDNNLKIRLDVAASSRVSSALTLSLDGVQSKTLNLKTLSMYEMYELGKASTEVFSLNAPNDHCTLNLTYAVSNLYATAYLNFIEVNARRKLVMNGSAMEFQNVDYLGTNTFNRYQISAAADIQIWDITNPVNVTQLNPDTPTADKITFTDSALVLKRYLAIDTKASAAFPSPEIVGMVQNQNLHAIQQADMVIITHPQFFNQAETLAQAHRQNDNMTVAVVTTEQVYNEFSSGTPDATAYRRLMRMFYDRATAAGNVSERPAYLLLFGKGVFDNRSMLDDSGESLVLTYQADNSLNQIVSYVTDDYFSYLEDGEGVQPQSYSMDVAVGRFPVTTTQQATDVVNKTIRYMHNTDYGSWKNQLCVVADDGDSNYHITQADNNAQTLSDKLPAFHANKVYLDAFSQTSSKYGQTCLPAKEKLQSVLNAGAFYLNYTGHGFIHGWAHEKLLTDTDIVNLKNRYLPLWVSASCDFMKFDTRLVSAGEQVVLNPNGGGIGILAAAREVYSSQNFALNSNLIQNLFTKKDGQYLSVGNAIQRAKNSIAAEINKLSFIYMGDPALKLNYADKYHVVITKINDNSNFSGNDTLHSKSINNIHGYIADDNQQKVTDFNGRLSALLYDKTKTVTTLGDENSDAKTFDFSERALLLASDDVSVVHGEFSYSFTLPESMDDNAGVGKFIFYAADETTHNEAQGYLNNFIVGANENTSGIQLLADTEIAYAVANFPNPAHEQTNFVPGGQTNILSYTIEISDLTGKFVHAISSSGPHKTSWNLTTQNGQKLAPGIYFYIAKIQTPDALIYTKAKKLVVN